MWKHKLNFMNGSKIHFHSKLILSCRHKSSMSIGIRNICYINQKFIKTHAITKLRQHFSISTQISSFSSSSLASLLKPEQIDLINEQKVLFDHLYKNVNKLNLGQDVLELIIDSKNKIDDLFMVVVVGKFSRV